MKRIVIGTLLAVVLATTGTAQIIQPQEFQVVTPAVAQQSGTYDNETGALTYTFASPEQFESWAVLLDGTAHTTTFQINSKGDIVFSINLDTGEVTFGEGMTQDEASRAFWRYVAEHSTCRGGADR